MSILVAQASTPTLNLESLPRSIQIAATLLILGGPLVSIALAWLLGIFRRDSLRGTERLGADETSWRLVWIVIMSIVVTMMSGGLLLHMLGHLPEEPRAVLAGTLATAVGAVTLIVLNAAMRHDGTRRLGLNVGRLPRGLIVAPLALIIILPWVEMIAMLLGMAIKHYGIDVPLEHDLFRILREQGEWFRMWGIASAAFIAPFTEELIFRGMVQTILRRWLGGPWAAVILTSVVFAAVHNPWPIKLPIFVLSLGLGYAYERTGNLWVSILMHALFNGMNVALFTLMQGYT